MTERMHLYTSPRSQDLAVLREPGLCDLPGELTYSNIQTYSAALHASSELSSDSVYVSDVSSVRIRDI